MTASLEKLRPSALVTPSTKYRDDFLMLLDKRWQEFDIATMHEANTRNILNIAGNTKTLRDNDEDFKSAKVQFDEAIASLKTIQSDNELKSLLKGPGKLSATIASLGAYFAKLNTPEKAKEHNQVLASTLADLTSLKAKITETAEDKKSAEVARANIPSTTTSSTDIGGDLVKSIESSVPAMTTTIAGLGATVVGTGLVTESGWKKTLAEGFGKFKDWITGLLPENGIFAGLKDGIMKFFATLGGGFGIKNAVADTIPIEQIKEMNPTYGITKSVIKRFFLKKEGNSTAIYDIGAFQDMKYSDIKKAYDTRKTTSLTKAFGLLEGTGTTDTDIEDAIAIFVDDFSKKGKHLRAQIDKTLGKEKENLTMKEIFMRISSPLNYLHTMGDIGDAISTGNMNALSDNIGFDIHGTTGEISGPLKTNMEKIPPKVRMGMLVSHSDLQFLNTTQAMKVIDGTKQYTEDEKKKWEKVFNFGERFQKAVLGNPKIHLGMQSDFQKAFLSPGLSYFGLASLYACTAGETDFENMTAAEKLSFYGGCASIAGSMDSFAKGKFGMRYLDQLNLDSSDIPPEVKELGTDILGGAMKATAHGLKETGLAILGMAVEKPQYVLGIAAIGYATGGVRRGIHKWRYH